MDLVKYLRQNIILGKKRFRYFKYNLAFRKQRGNLYDIGDDMRRLEKEHTSINLLDFSSQIEDFYLIEEHSDAT